MQMAADPALDTPALAVRLERRLARVTQLLRTESRPRASVAALLTLRRLDDEGPLRITELAAAERVAQPSMTGLVGRLEQEGFVRRTPDARDARAVRVVLTSAGRAELAAVRSTRAAVLQARLDALGDDARAALAAAMPALDELLSTEPRP
jgi:DNA-binding MarR family transcriptional regulator